MCCLGSSFTTSPRESNTGPNIPCQNSSGTPLFVDLTLYFREYLSVLQDFTLNTKLPQHFALSCQDWKHSSFWEKSATAEKHWQWEPLPHGNHQKIKKTCMLLVSRFLAIFLSCSGYSHGHPALDLHLPMLHTLYFDTSLWSWICSTKNTRNWFCTYKANRHIESFPGHTQLKIDRKLSPGSSFIQTQQICVLL